MYFNFTLKKSNILDKFGRMQNLVIGVGGSIIKNRIHYLIMRIMVTLT